MSAVVWDREPSTPKEACDLLDAWCADVAAVTGKKVADVAPKVVSFVAVALLVSPDTVSLEAIHSTLLEAAPGLVR